MKRYTLLIVLLSLAGCGGGGSEKSAPAPTVITPTPPIVVSVEQNAINFAYDATYSVPEGFYEDPRAGSTVWHVPLTTLEGGDRCGVATTDPAVSDLITFANLKGYVWEGIEITYHTLYTELEVEDPTNGQPVFVRMYVCTVYDRQGVDATLDGYGGTIGADERQPVVIDAVVSKFHEYTYTHRDWDNLDVKVLSTSSSTASHTLEVVTVLPSTDGSCDAVEVGDWTFTADSVSGEITKTYVVTTPAFRANTSGVCN